MQRILPWAQKTVSLNWDSLRCPWHDSSKHHPINNMYKSLLKLLLNDTHCFFELGSDVHGSLWKARLRVFGKSRQGRTWLASCWLFRYRSAEKSQECWWVVERRMGRRLLVLVGLAGSKDIDRRPPSTNTEQLSTRPPSWLVDNPASKVTPYKHRLHISIFKEHTK